jgi:hypothetical protein
MCQNIDLEIWILFKWRLVLGNKHCLEIRVSDTVRHYIARLIPEIYNKVFI